MNAEQPEWTPAFEGQRPPFEPGNAVGRQFEEGNATGRQVEAGNELAVQTGAYSARYVEPLAKELVAALLADPTVPAHAKAAAYRLELLALGRAEAQVQLVTEFLGKRAEANEDGLPDFGDQRVLSAYVVLHRAETRAASARSRLGLNPAAAARLGKDVAVGQAATADVALRMAQLHAAEERLREQGWTPPAGWVDAPNQRDDGTEEER